MFLCTLVKWAIYGNDTGGGIYIEFSMRVGEAHKNRHRKQGAPVLLNLFVK